MSFFRFMVAAIIAIICTVLIVGYAHSAVLRGDSRSCTDIGQFMLTLEDMRDAGVPWSAVEPRIQEQIDAVRGHPETYITNENIAKYVMARIKTLWDYPTETAFALAVAAYTDCMRIPQTKRVML